MADQRTSVFALRSAARFWLVLNILGVVLLWASAVTARGEPYNGTAFAVPGRFEAEEFDRGGEGEAYHGEGAVVVAVHRFESGGTITNVWDPLPRERPDADIAVGTTFSNNVSLGLRPKEWVKYTISVEAEGYYEIGFLAGGAKVPTATCFNPDTLQPGEGRYPEFTVSLDGKPVAQVLASGWPTTGRIWLSNGIHELRLTCDWAPTFAWECLWGSNNIGYGFWYARTCSINWIQIMPAAVQLRADSLPASLGNSKLISELPSGDLVVWPQFGNRLLTVGRDGAVSGFVGGASNGPSEGRGTNVTFAQITQCAAAPNGDVFVLQPEAETNGIISQITPDGDVRTVFRGLLMVSNVMTRVAGGWITPVDLHIPVQRLSVDSENGLLVSSTYFEAIPSNNPLIHEYLEHSAWFRILADGTTAPPNWPTTLFRADESVIDDNYRLQNGTIVRVEDGFSLKVLGAGAGWLTSAYRSADGTIWAIELGGGVYRMSPQPEANYLTVNGPTADVEVKGVPSRGVNPDEVIQLQVVSRSGFWTLARWSDGATNNPRTLSITRDTTLTFEVERRLPKQNGLAPKSVQLRTPGTIAFSLIGPGEDVYSYPYRYLLEWSTDLKSWKPATGMKTVAGFGQISGSEVIAEKPTTPVELSFPDTTDLRFLRATLRY